MREGPRFEGGLELEVGVVDWEVGAREGAVVFTPWREFRGGVVGRWMGVRRLRTWVFVLGEVV